MASVSSTLWSSLRTAWLLVVLWVLSCCTGCSVREDYDTLSFWFDGVPTQEELEARRLAKEQREALLASQQSGQLTSQQRAAMLSVRVQVVESSTHKPVQEKKCPSCHVLAGSEDTPVVKKWMSDLPELRMPPSQLCLGCHERPVGAYVHGPAASGNCSICHHAHASLNPHLLRNARQEILCRSCHQGGTFATETNHAEAIGEKDCIECHNPHHAERQYLLRPEAPSFLTQIGVSE